MSQIVFLFLMVVLFMLGVPVVISLGLTSVLMMYVKGGIK